MTGIIHEKVFRANIIYEVLWNHHFSWEINIHGFCGLPLRINLRPHRDINIKVIFLHFNVTNQLATKLRPNKPTKF